MDDYYKKLKVEMHSFIDSELYKIALNILPKREKHFFSSEDLLDSIFIIEKFLYGNIYPQKWSISFSSKFEKPNEDNTKKDLDRLRSLSKKVILE
ncbi:hypothetical protein EW093_17125 (plasmid) [Thiospirochaeta perfilievii]|uniref:Uncharacterized protein n=1 Tax=Thiospirochaeta perfilievii TaxID=252967 RepID=A0A5C1QHG8_9SPIO|nr:hypothetical protein [Thiospirochaeta perfilievii]QEN06430.1 hypothetical protein EW093_17125 [Thiospirochaeta perfilievii]